jgi:hypothetical protein
VAARGGIILDPSTIITGRAELSLTDLGLELAQEGADFGESAIETQLSRHAIGSVVTDRHLEPVEMTIPLIVSDDAELSLAEVQQPVEQKIGRWHEEGGWLQRDFADAGGFAGSVAYQILRASLSGFQGWAYEHKQLDVDVVIKALRSPLCYVTVEAESDVFKSEEGARELIFTLAEILGTSPGLIRIRIINEGEEHWSALILAGESRDMAQDETADTTAAPAYSAADLTLKGGAEVKTVSGVQVVEHASLTAGWLSILNSKVVAEELGHMTHLGVRRVLVRAEAVEGEPKDVQLHLRWRVLGSVTWTDKTMPIVPLNIIGDYQLFDLGECRPEPAALGDQRWEWDLQARAVSGAGKVRLHRVWPLPTEQFAVVEAADALVGADMQSQKSPATTASQEVEGGGTIAWSSAGNIVSSNNSYATATLGGGEGYAYTQWLRATNFGFAIPEGTIVGVIVEVERVSNSGKGGEVRDSDLKLIKAGTIQGASRESGAIWSTVEHYQAYGAAGDLWDLALTPAQVNSSTFGVALKALLNPPADGTGSEPLTASVDHVRITVYYSTEADGSLVCYAERSAEFRSDGIFRQHPEDDVWGELIPEGFMPYASPSGLEGRKSRYIVIPSQGNLRDLPDVGEISLSAQEFDRAAYLFSREAA